MAGPQPDRPALPAACYRHPDQLTGIVCTRCGRPICAHCMVPAAVGFQCPDCVRGGQASVRAPRPHSGVRSAAGRWGPVTLAMIAVNVVMFAVTAVSAALAGHNPVDTANSPVFADLAQVPVLVAAGEWWRMFTAAFLHVGVLHIVFNMLALLIFGSEIERALGRWRYLAVYLLSIAGGAASIQLFGPPTVFEAGSSTAIFGLLGALGVLMVAGRQDLRGLLTLLAINVVISFFPGISLAGHVGGLVAGALATTVLLATRHRHTMQATALVALGVVLVALALSAPALVVGGL